jgi:hypothetical protein
MDTGPIAAGPGGLPTLAGQSPASPAPSVAGPRVARHVVALGAVILMIAVAALALIATAARPATQFAPGSPEAVFQAYLTAWDANDLDTAYATFSSRVHADVAIEEYRTLARSYPQRGADRRVVLLDATTTGDRATLDLRVDEFSGSSGVFGGQSVWSRPLTVDLVREQGAWLLDAPLADLEAVYWYQK